MDRVHELAHSAGVHTWHPDCVNLVPVLLTWHSTLYNNGHALLTIATEKYRLLWEGWAYNGLNIKHLLQLPLKRTLSARHLHCMCCHLNSALLQAFENTSAPKVVSRLFLKLCELDY
jgi:hypothetical protein